MARVDGLDPVAGRTDGQGRFALEGVAEGSRTLVVVAADGRRLTAQGVVVGPAESTGPLRLYYPP